MSASNRDEGLDRVMLERYEVPGAPAGFSVRLMVAIDDVPAPRAYRYRRWGIAAAVVAVAIVAIVLMTRTSAGAAGQQFAVVRETAQLGTRGVAVLEPGADIRWVVDSSGDAEIDQQAGDVFYRVEHGGQFKVRTPIGTVSVTGTSFRVELKENHMKSKTLKAGATGAALATALLVTVYEGRVLLADNEGSVALGAGESGSLTVGVLPRSSREAVALPAMGARTADDLTRATARIAELEHELRELKGDHGRLAADPGRYFAPSRATLLDMAEKCWLAYDLPPLSADQAVELVSSDLASRAKLGDRERSQVNESYQNYNDQILVQLRALYTELTGDTAGATTLSVKALGSEIKSKTPPGEELAARRRIARERALLEPRPTEDELRARPVIERYLRMQVFLGDAAEASAAAVIGTDRARAMRAIDGIGWNSSVSDYGGCDPQQSSN
jgi:hypothetical protein